MVHCSIENHTKVIPSFVPGIGASIYYNFMMYKYFICLIVMGLLSILTLSLYAQDTNVMNSSVFQQNIKNTSVQVYDVRTSQEFNTGHLQNTLQADYTYEEEFTDSIKYLNKEQLVLINEAPATRRVLHFITDKYLRTSSLHIPENTWPPVITDKYLRTSLLHNPENA